jgi:hypothetical protein
MYMPSYVQSLSQLNLSRLRSRWQSDCQHHKQQQPCRPRLWHGISSLPGTILSWLTHDFWQIDQTLRCCFDTSRPRARCVSSCPAASAGRPTNIQGAAGSTPRPAVEGAPEFPGYARTIVGRMVIYSGRGITAFASADIMAGALQRARWQHGRWPRTSDQGVAHVYCAPIGLLQTLSNGTVVGKRFGSVQDGRHT